MSEKHGGDSEYRVQFLINELEFITLRVRHDLSKYGEWRCDYDSWRLPIVRELETFIGSLPQEEDNGTTAAEDGVPPF